MKNFKEFNVELLERNLLEEVNGGSDFGNWLVDTVAAGICGIRSWWANIPKGYVPGEGAGYDHNAMSLPG